MPTEGWLASCHLGAWALEMTTWQVAGGAPHFVRESNQSTSLTSWVGGLSECALLLPPSQQEHRWQENSWYCPLKGALALGTRSFFPLHPPGPSLGRKKKKAAIMLV